MNGDGARLQPDAAAVSTVSSVLRLSTEYLAATRLGVARASTPSGSSSKATGLERIELYMELDRPLTPPELATTRELVRRRGAREPLQYVLGEWGFRRLTLIVDRRALIPQARDRDPRRPCARPDRLQRGPRVLDVGTGSGAIALAIADEHPGADVTGIDASEDALALAAENVERTGWPGDPRAWDLFHGLPEGPWDLVVSNPPYVAVERPAHPRTGGAGLGARRWRSRQPGAVEAVVCGAAAVLAPGGGLALEVGEGQAGGTAALLETLGLVDVRVTPDLTGTDRVVEGRMA